MLKSLLFFIVILLSFSDSWSQVTISGQVVDKIELSALPFANVILSTSRDSTFATGSASDEEGRFSLEKVLSGSYILEISTVGFATYSQDIFVGSLTQFLDLGLIELNQNSETLDEVTVVAQQEAIGSKMDKKTYTLAENISQGGGSVLQAMQNLPGVTVQDGKIQLRGSDQVAVLMDGKQTALTGFGTQSGLDNIPSSAIEKIEIINNPSAKYDANGNAGIINIIYKKNIQEGWNGKIGLTGGLGALWERQPNLSTIRPQYARTPKINPSLSLNYRKNQINTYIQADYMYKETLNKNEFVIRTYQDGSIINQQSKRNRDTGISTGKAGMDWELDDQNSISISGLLSIEDIIDRGDEPFFNSDLSERLRLWQFLEDEVKTTATASTYFKHRYKQAGHTLDIGLNYTFHREDEKYFFDNILPTFSGEDSFVLLSDEHVVDFNLDYVRPLRAGRIEGGLKFRRRNIPTNMQFFPGLNSPLDVDAGGEATYKEIMEMQHE